MWGIPGLQAHPGILMSKPNSMLGHRQQLYLTVAFLWGVPRSSKGNCVVSILILSYLQLSMFPSPLAKNQEVAGKKRGQNLSQRLIGRTWRLFALTTDTVTTDLFS